MGEVGVKNQEKIADFYGRSHTLLGKPLWLLWPWVGITYKAMSALCSSGICLYLYVP